MGERGKSVRIWEFGHLGLVLLLGLCVDLPFYGGFFLGF